MQLVYQKQGREEQKFQTKDLSPAEVEEVRRLLKKALENPHQNQPLVNHRLVKNQQPVKKQRNQQEVESLPNQPEEAEAAQPQKKVREENQLQSPVSESCRLPVDSLQLNN